jgi:hypothetical protein
MAAPIHGFIIAEDEAMAGWIGFDLEFVVLGSDYHVKIRGAEVGWNAVALLRLGGTCLYGEEAPLAWNYKVRRRLACLGS